MNQRQQNRLPKIFDSLESDERNNLLYYGDNLTFMQQHMKTASVDLIYLDPPFNSQRNYNLIYKKLTGQPVPEQVVAFCDAWEMDRQKEQMVRDMSKLIKVYHDEVDPNFVKFWSTWIKALQQTQPHLLAYLLFMSFRLFEMKRILKPTGSIYLHCDQTASHYIKVIMDGIFGHQNFRNEIIWKRTFAHGNVGRNYGSITDTILWYTKGDSYNWNQRFTVLTKEEIEIKYPHIDNNGRRWQSVTLRNPGQRPNLHFPYTASNGITYQPHVNGWSCNLERLQKYDREKRLHFPTKPDGALRLKMYADESPGERLQNIWDDIPPIAANAKERLGYPTQKPISLLERIVSASSNEGDVVFDPFAGCGTAIYAAHQLGRRWIGCDIAILSVQIVRNVLLKRYGLQEGKNYIIDGVPLSVEGAQELLTNDAVQFQHWAVELAGGFSSKCYSSDSGIDGRLYFETQGSLKSMVISVKSGKLTPAYMRELRGVLERENNAELGGMICLQEPTKGMWQEVAMAGNYEYRGTEYERLQIRTIRQLLDGNGFHTPSQVQTLNWVKAIQPSLF